MQKNKKFYNKKFKYVFNFCVTPEEKELLFALKALHRLNNNIGNDNEDYSNFLKKMSCYYKQILVGYNH
jgi:hypothetical protein